jgi:hypothetical protein
MVNGDPGDMIYNCKGLRKGDPISPMLFILTMEPLQKMFEVAASRGVLIPLARVGMKKHLSIFADDVVLLVKPNPVDLAVCKCIFKLFGEAAGRKINMCKSAALPIRCSEEEITTTCNELQCPLGSFLIKYLGLPLSLRKQSMTQLQYLMDQMANRLPKWKATLMPKSGRLTWFSQCYAPCQFMQ